MMPFNPSFRRLLSRFIPRLSKKDVEKYENAVVVMHQLLIERNLEPRTAKSGGPNPKWTRLNSDLIEARSGAGDILQAHRARFLAIQKRYVAQRRLGFLQGKFQQLPSSPGKVVQLARAQGALLAAQVGFIKTFGLALVAENVSAKAVATAAVVVLLGFGINAFNETIGIRQSLAVIPKLSLASATFTQEGLIRRAQLSAHVTVTVTDANKRSRSSEPVDVFVRFDPATTFSGVAPNMPHSEAKAFVTLKIPPLRDLSTFALRRAGIPGGKFEYAFEVYPVSASVDTSEGRAAYAIGLSMVVSTDSLTMPFSLAATARTTVVQKDLDPSTGVATVVFGVTVTTISGQETQKLGAVTDTEKSSLATIKRN